MDKRMIDAAVNDRTGTLCGYSWEWRRDLCTLGAYQVEPGAMVMDRGSLVALLCEAHRTREHRQPLRTALDAAGYAMAAVRNLLSQSCGDPVHDVQLIAEARTMLTGGEEAVDEALYQDRQLPPPGATAARLAQQDAAVARLVEAGAAHLLALDDLNATVLERREAREALEAAVSNG